MLQIDYWTSTLECIGVLCISKNAYLYTFKNIDNDGTFTQIFEERYFSIGDKVTLKVNKI